MHQTLNAASHVPSPAWLPATRQDQPGDSSLHARSSIEALAGHALHPAIRSGPSIGFRVYPLSRSLTTGLSQGALDGRAGMCRAFRENHMACEYCCIKLHYAILLMVCHLQTSQPGRKAH